MNRANAFVVVMACGMYLTCASNLLAQDWPQWRGPTRDGHARDARLPARWPETPPEPTWRVTIGEGYSGPAVADGLVFITDRQKGPETERVLCLDAETGEEIWSFNLNDTNFIEISLESDGTTPFAKLLPGDFAIFPASTPTMYAKADTGSCNMQVCGVER